MRQVPRAIAEFGERQFKEVGPLAVEVLRVKASTIRKHFRRLAGIAFLVAVISRDRVRVYFFDSAAKMLLGENIDPQTYVKIRKTSRLITKYERPREPTPEEIRMEATEEIRSLLARAIKRVSRLVARSEPSFPLLYVTKDPSSTGQLFGTVFVDDGSILFEESAIQSHWIEGVVLRVAFLLHLDTSRRGMEINGCIANGVASSLLRGDVANHWFDIWIKKSQNSELLPLVHHLIMHSSTYATNGYRWLLTFLEQAPPDLEYDSIFDAIKTIHQSVTITLGTEDYHIIRGLCNYLRKPRKLALRRHSLRSIHLVPRAVGNPWPLGDALAISEITDEEESKIWTKVQYMNGTAKKSFVIGTIKGDLLRSYEYGLNIEDIFPKPGGIVTHGRDVVRWALQRVGLVVPSDLTFSAKLEFMDADIPSDQKAVLSRICEGGMKILADSLVGSPQRISKLVESGHLILLPEFHHIGLDHDFLVVGPPDDVRTVVSSNTVEYSIFITDTIAYAVVSCPSDWKPQLLAAVTENSLAVHPILATYSTRGLLRDEPLFPFESLYRIWF